MKLLFLALLLSQSPSDVVVDTDPGPATGAVVVDGPAAGDAVVVHPSPGDDVQTVLVIVGDVIKLASAWKAVGGLALAAALLALLVRLSKLGVLGRLLEQRRLGWVRPVIAAALGGASAGVAAAQAGQQVLPAVVGGILAGLSGIGLHELGRLASTKERQRQRVDRSSLTIAANALEERVRDAQRAHEASMAAVDAEIAEAAKLPPAKRTEALARMLARTPPPGGA